MRYRQGGGVARARAGQEMASKPRPVTDSEATGHAIRRTRLSHRMSQTELARCLGVTQTTVSFWERGIEQPTFVHLVKLAFVFPELAALVYASHEELIRRVERLERVVHGGRCRCVGCSCGQTTP